MEAPAPAALVEVIARAKIPAALHGFNMPLFHRKVGGAFSVSLPACRASSCVLTLPCANPLCVREALLS
jgi:hypothetical protein